MSTSATNATSSISAASGGDMNEQQFLQLLVTQLQNQDPLQPQDNSQFIAELAQFSSLQQEQTNGATEQQLLAETQSIRGLGLDGHTVTYASGNGTAQDTVSGVGVAGSSIDLLLQSGATIGIDSVNTSN